MKPALKPLYSGLAWQGFIYWLVRKSSSQNAKCTCIRHGDFGEIMLSWKAEKAVTAYLKDEQLLHLSFALQQCSAKKQSIVSQWTQNVCITFVKRWTNVEDAGPALYKCYTNVLCLLGIASFPSRQLLLFTLHENIVLAIVTWYIVPVFQISIVPSAHTHQFSHWLIHVIQS